MSWISLADEVAALIWLIDTDVSGPVNLVAPGPVTNAEFTHALARTLRRPSWLPVPVIAFRALFGEMASLVLCGQRALPERLQSAGYAFRYPHLDEALQDII